MRILMTADAMGGVWSYALELVRELGARGHEVALATLGSLPRPAQARAAAAMPNLELFTRECALEWMENPWREVDAAGDWLLDLERKIEPDVAHINGYAHAALPFRCPIAVVAHSCVLSWWRGVKGSEAPRSWDRYRRRVARGLEAADAVIAPSAAILEAITDAHGVPIEGEVIANGVAPERHRPARAEPFVLAAGRLWDEAKNLAALAACARDLPWPVRIAGPRRHPDGRLVEVSGVDLLGVLEPPELAAWMGRASIYALPARYEPFGLSILEAALSGCALVLGDIATLRELWGNAAVFVAPDDPGALATALRGLIFDPRRRRQLARDAMERAARFSAAEMGRSYVGLYQRLMAPAAAAASLAGVR